MINENQINEKNDYKKWREERAKNVYANTG